MSIDEATLARLRELAEAGKVGGWQEVLTALDIGDIILGIRDGGERGAVRAAQEATGMGRATLWRRAKLAEHREPIERERPANLTEALRLVQRLEAADGEPEKAKGGRPKRDPLEVLTERLRGTASLLAQQGLVGEEEALAIVRAAYAEVPGARVAGPDTVVEGPLVIADGPGGPQVTAVLADSYGEPFVCRGRLSRLRIDPTLNGLTPERRLSLGIEGPGRRKDRSRSYGREMPSPLVVLEGADAEVRVATNPNRPRVLWHDEAAFRAVWEDVARQARATGRRIIFDSIAEAITDRDREAPRQRVENAAREAAMREFATDRGTVSS